MPAVNCLSATALAKKTSATLNSLKKGETEKLIILKNNTPKAVLLSYEALKEELEDLPGLCPPEDLQTGRSALA